MLDIHPVTKDNWRALVELKVHPDQQHFVASNVTSIAEAQFGYDDPQYGHWDMYPFGIYDGEKPAGFLMYGYNYGHPETQAFIIRLMVDQELQGRGYGKYAMTKMLEIFRANDRVRAVGISYEPENEIARKLYAGLGFVETGEIVRGEAVAVLKLR